MKRWKGKPPEGRGGSYFGSEKTGGKDLPAANSAHLLLLDTGAKRDGGRM